ncbi:hypothetical protein CRV24_008630 [Beauveria bassiana]|nr:hypothetical protein CRV24_008630 [Beauveria bassiana]KAH8716711.1 hypothetical protein HC256_005470 [Beauveria bassiana]
MTVGIRAASEPAAAAVLAPLQLAELGAAAAAAAGAVGAARGVDARRVATQTTVHTAEEVAGGGQDAGNHVYGGLDEGVNHGPARGVPGRVGEEGRGEEDGEAEGAGDDAQGGGEKGEHEADFLGDGHLQTQEDGPGSDEHDEIGGEAGDAVELLLWCGNLVMGALTDARCRAAKAKDVAQSIAHEHGIAHGLWVVVAAGEEDGEEKGVDDDEGDADALVQARVVGHDEALW